MPAYNFESGNHKMGCTDSLVKYLLFAFNFVFWIFSVAILSLGIVFKLQVDSVTKYFPGDFPIAPDLFIAVGTVAFIVSFFGCFGAWKENRCALFTYVCFLILLLIIELAVVIIAFIALNNSKLADEIKSQMNRELCEGGLKEIERSIECCGVVGPEDYTGNISTCPATTIPDSCYPAGDKTRVRYEDGCYNKFVDSVKNMGKTLGGIGITVALMQVMGVAFAIILARAIKEERGF